MIYCGGMNAEDDNHQDLPPGTLVYVGEETARKTYVDYVDYSKNDSQEGTTQILTVENIPQIFDRDPKAGVRWVNVSDVHEINLIEAIGNHLGIQPLVLEDIVNTEQRPRIDDLDDYLFFTLKQARFSEREEVPVLDQISIIVFPRLVITFQETGVDIFKPLRGRIRSGKGGIRAFGSDYLAYAILDSIVDDYLHVLEDISESVEKLEDEVIGRPRPKHVERIQDFRRSLSVFRRAIWPLREMISAMRREGTSFVRDETRVFLADLLDHVFQTTELLDSVKDVISGLMDAYHSNISSQMNEVMKVLALIATIFIPLTFLAGIYGMNFDFMPELGWKWGYAGFWGIIGAVATTMVVLFKKKGWL